MATRAGAMMLAAGVAVLAQQATPPNGLTLAQAVEAALHNYPSIRISQEQINAASAGMQLARTAYLPRVDLLAQANRATRNNVFGLLLPQSTIPSMSGPAAGGGPPGQPLAVCRTGAGPNHGLRRQVTGVTGRPCGDRAEYGY